MDDPLRFLLNKLSPGVRRGYGGRIYFREKQVEELTLLLNRVVHDKESMSIVVYGEPGSGRSTFVESCLADLSKEKAFKKGHRVVRLDGLWCKDLKSSIEEICYQLKVELEEFDENSSDFDDQLEYMVDFLKKELTNCAQSVVFILDNIDLITEHKGQKLLYNLLDISQTNVAVGVIGITTTLDLLELFEKRVKSRFSHRQINLVSYTFAQYTTIFQLLLNVPNNSDWNAQVWTLMKNPMLNPIISKLYENDKSLATLVNFLYSTLLTCKGSSISLEHFQAQLSKTERNMRVCQALDLSTRELLLLIGIHKQVGTSTMAFSPAQVWQIIGNVAKMKGIDKTAFMTAFEVLERRFMVLPVDRTVGINKIDSHFKTELEYNEFKQIFSEYPNLPTDFRQFL